MVQVLRLLRRLPVAEKIQDIAIFINRELLPFLQELRESTAATFEQVTTNRLLGRDSPGTGDVEEIALDDTLEFTGSGSIQRAEITGDVEIPAGSNVAVVPALPGLQSAIVDITTDVTALENAEYITYTSNASLTNERVATTSASIEVDLGTAGQAKWNTMPPAVFAVTVGGALGSYSLPSGVKSGDTIRFTITADTTLAALFLFGAVLPFEGMELNICLSDQSGGSAPGWTFTIADQGTGAPGQFRTPGQVQGTLPGPSYVMQSEEEGMRIAFQEANWRIIAGTAAQAITGDILVSAGNGSTRDSQIAPGVIVNADVNASAAIAQTKLGATTGFSVKASGASATTSAEPIVTYSASANMSAERVTTASTSITINTGVASQIAFERAALTGAITASANSNSTLFDTNASGAGLTGGGTAVLAVGAGASITVNANDVAYTGTTDEILLSAITGNQGTIDISTLDCGGTVRVNAASSAFSIEGFTAKPVGFWFNFVTQDEPSDDCTLLNEDLTATAANRLQLPNAEDIQCTPLAGTFVYCGESRWRWLGSNPNLCGTRVNGIELMDNSEVHIRAGSGAGIFLEGSSSTLDIDGTLDFTSLTTGSLFVTATDAVTVTAPDVEIAGDTLFSEQVAMSKSVQATGIFSTTLAASGNNLAIGQVSAVRIALTGAQNLTGMVPSGAGHMVFILNIDTSDILTIVHNSGSSSAGNQFACPGGVNFALQPLGMVIAWFDTTLGFWWLGSR
jgi:hypothetical protein